MAPKPKKAVVTTTTTTTWKDPGTLGSDEEVPMFDESDSDGEAPVAAPKGKKKVAAAAAAASAAKGNRPSGGLNPSFKFEADSGIESAWDFSMAKSFASGSNRRGTSVNEKIKQRLLQPTSLQPKAPKRKRGEEDEEGEEDDDEDEDEEDEDEDEEGEDEEGDEDDDDDDEEGDEDDEEGDEDDDDDDDDDDKLEDADEEDEKPSKKHKAKQDNEDEEDEEDDDIAKAKQARKDAFFSSAPNSGSDSSASETFVGLNLSRPIMRALTQLGFDKPTPIQSQTIPLAMQGLDICASAVTGSGKTAAFMIPILERLLFRPQDAPTSRVLVLTPTRELAVQCHSVAVKLARFTDIQFALLVGGLSNKAQEAVLRRRPDVLIATPGRLIDHLQNAPSFDLNSLEILVMDEADRMLEDGFKEELTEIIRHCPRGRQTMLFSASMTDDVDDLISLSLNSPVRLFVDKSNQLASKLIQEFIRVRNEGDRESIVLALCKKTFHTQCIVFFASKKATHRMKLLFGLNGLNAAELHGDLTQKDRLEALELFRDGKVDYLLCTDVASRGLDIVGIKTVINMHMPAQFKAYLHRVGRTARAGREGRSVSLIGEQERKLLRMAVKNAKDAVRKRVIQPETLTKFRLKIQEQESQVTGILGEERAEKQMNQAEMELTKAENMIKHSDEISSRPARTWFQTPAQKKAAAAEAEKAAKKAAMPKIKRSKTDGMSRTKRRRFLSREEDKVAADKMKGSLRSIKAQAKPKRLAKVDDTPAKAEKKGGSAKKGNVGFTHELTNTSKKSLAGLRSAGKQIPGKQLPGATAGKKSTSASGKKGGDDSKSSSSAKKHEHKMLGKKRAKHQFKSQARYKRR